MPVAVATSPSGAELRRDDRCASPAPAPGTPIWREQPDDGHPHTLRDGLLTLATLGVYGFWATTRLRRRVWGRIVIDGRPLAYTGTARELWLPALCVALAVAAIVLAGVGVKWWLGAIPRPRLGAFRSPWRLTLTVPLLVVLAMGTWRVREFLVRRTAWRGAGGRLLPGSRVPYVLRHVATTLGLALSAGWAYPWRSIVLHRQLMHGATIAGMSVSVAGDARPLYRRFWIAWLGGLLAYLGAVVTLGLLHGPKILEATSQLAMPGFTAAEWMSVSAILLAGLLVFLAFAAVYQAAEWRHLAAITRLDGRALHLDLPTAGYVRVALVTALAKLASLGLLGAFAQAHRSAYLLARLSLAPPPAITPRSASAPLSADG